MDEVLAINPRKHRKPIPIYYVPIHPKDRDRVDSYSWSVLFGALTAYWISKQMSKWVTPDKYYVLFHLGFIPKISFPKYGVISSENNFFVCYDGKHRKTGSMIFKWSRRFVLNADNRKEGQNIGKILEMKYQQKNCLLKKDGQRDTFPLTKF